MYEKCTKKAVIHKEKRTSNNGKKVVHTVQNEPDDFYTFFERT